MNSRLYFPQRHGLRRRRQSRGQTLLIAALIVSLVVAIAGGTIDLAVADEHRAVDSAAGDGAALAAASEVELSLRNFDTAAQTVANADRVGNTVAASGGCSGSCSITYQYQEADGAIAPTVQEATEVTATVTDTGVPLVFGRIPSVGPLSLVTYATALIPTGSSLLPLGCTVCTLGTSGGGGNLDFTPGLVIPPICVLTVCAPTVTASLEQALSVTGTIQGNGATGVVDPPGLNINTADSVTSTAFGVSGTASFPPGWTISPAATTGNAVIPNPLANALPPEDTGLSVQGGNGIVTLPTSGGTLSPGIYSEICGTGLNNATVTFNPGVYFILGSGASSSTSSCASFGAGLFLQDSSGTSVVTGSGVTFYFGCGSITTGVAYPTACTAGESGPNVNLNGSIDPSLTSPTSGAGQNLLFYFDPQDASTLTINLLPATVSGSPGLYGSIYGASTSAMISTGLATVNTTAITDLTTCITDAIMSLNLTVTYLASCLGTLSGLFQFSIGSLVTHDATFSGTVVQYNLYDSTPVDAGLGQAFLTMTP